MTTPRRIEMMLLGDVPRALRNPKTHDVATIRGSLEKFGCTVAGVLDERTGRLVAGHGRLETLTRMQDDGESPPEGVTLADDGADWLVPIVRGWSSRSDAEAEAYLIADNRLSERGGWDNPLLAEVLDDVADYNPDLVPIAGYSHEELADLIAAMGAPPSLEDLEREYGEPDDAELWPLLRFKVPWHIRAAFMDLTEDYGEDDDSGRFVRLIEAVQRDREGAAA